MGACPVGPVRWDACSRGTGLEGAFPEKASPASVSSGAPATTLVLGPVRTPRPTSVAGSVRSPASPTPVGSIVPADGRGTAPSPDSNARSRSATTSTAGRSDGSFASIAWTSSAVTSSGSETTSSSIGGGST